MDLATAQGARARYARLCVKVDLSKPLLGEYMVEDRVFYVEYESLDNICFSCGMYGHKLDSCPLTHPVEKADADVTVQVDSSQPAAEGDSGSWMTVKRRQKSGPKATGVTKKNSAPGSKFSILSNAEGEHNEIPKQPTAVLLSGKSPQVEDKAGHDASAGSSKNQAFEAFAAQAKALSDVLKAASAPR
ncbi:hypothetical protein LINPERPRIM_LOCUS22323 [Linum perenne]